MVLQNRTVIVYLDLVDCKFELSFFLLLTNCLYILLYQSFMRLISRNGSFSRDTELLLASEDEYDDNDVDTLGVDDNETFGSLGNNAALKV